MTIGQQRRRRLLNLLVLLVAHNWSTGQAWLGQPVATDAERPVLRRREPVPPVLSVLSVRARRMRAAAAEAPPPTADSATLADPTAQSPPTGSSWPAPLPAPSQHRWSADAAADRSSGRWAPSPGVSPATTAVPPDLPTREF